MPVSHSANEKRQTYAQHKTQTQSDMAQNKAIDTGPAMSQQQVTNLAAGTGIQHCKPHFIPVVNF